MVSREIAADPSQQLTSRKRLGHPRGAWWMSFPSGTTLRAASGKEAHGRARSGRHMFTDSLFPPSPSYLLVCDDQARRVLAEGNGLFDAVRTFRYHFLLDSFPPSLFGVISGLASTSSPSPRSGQSWPYRQQRWHHIR